MLRPPSLQSEYDLYCSADPVFVQLAEDATAEQAKAYSDAWKRARETGDYTSQLAPGHTLEDATKFVLRQLPGSVVRQLGDLQGTIGATGFYALVFRLALVNIVNGPPMKKLARHEDPSLHTLGLMAPASISDALDSIEFKIVNELGVVAWLKAMAPSPL